MNEEKIDNITPINASELTKGMIENMPTPTADPLISEQSTDDLFPEIPPDRPLTPENNSGEQIRDASGKIFDPNFHGSKDGKPLYDNDGNFQGKRGRKKGQKNKVDPETGEQTIPHNTGEPDAFDMHAEIMLQMSYGILASFFTDKIRPTDKTEHDSLKIPLAAVYREKGEVDIKPSWLLAASIIAYVGKKSAEPTVKERIALYYYRVKSFFTKKKQPPEKIENI